MIKNESSLDEIQTPFKKIESKIDEELLNKIASEYIEQLDFKFNSS
jgi:hypothetical protein